MTLDEYERVRGQRDRFAVVPGHESDEIERVVETADRYVIVDKRDEARAFRPVGTKFAGLEAAASAGLPSAEVGEGGALTAYPATAFAR